MILFSICVVALCPIPAPGEKTSGYVSGRYQLHQLLFQLGYSSVDQSRKGKNGSISWDMVLLQFQHIDFLFLWVYKKSTKRSNSEEGVTLWCPSWPQNSIGKVYFDSVRSSWVPQRETHQLVTLSLCDLSGAFFWKIICSFSRDFAWHFLVSNLLWEK